MRKLTIGFYIKDEDSFKEFASEMYSKFGMSQEDWGVYFLSHYDEAKRLEDIEFISQELSGWELEQELREVLAKDPDKYDAEERVDEWK